MIITFTFLLIGIGYLCYEAKDEVYLIREENTNEKDDIYIGLDDLFIWIEKYFFIKKIYILLIKKLKEKFHEIIN